MCEWHMPVSENSITLELSPFLKAVFLLLLGHHLPQCPVTASLVEVTFVFVSLWIGHLDSRSALEVGLH